MRILIWANQFINKSNLKAHEKIVAWRLPKMSVVSYAAAQFA
jgi:cysteine synthase